MDKHVVIIGAGIAGLAAGVYALRNGYRVTVLEQHAKPGGLCTAWERGGYVFDGCIHWLVGSDPHDPMHAQWDALGMLDDVRIIHHDVFLTIEDDAGRRLVVYEDIDRLEAEMLRVAPRDERQIRKLAKVMRLLSHMRSGPPQKKPGDGGPGSIAWIRGFLSFLPTIFTMVTHGRLSVEQYARRFRDPFLRDALPKIMYSLEGFSLLAFMFTLAWMSAKNAGYPVGGSLPLVRNIEKRLRSLGGDLRCNAAVASIIVESGHARGVKLATGEEIRADIVISCADGHATIHDLLGGKYVGEDIERVYRTFPRFPSIVQVSLGVAMTFDGPQSVMFPIAPLDTGGKMVTELMPHIYNFDPTMAPAGKTVVTMILPAGYEHWRDLRRTDRPRYDAEKQRIAREVIAILDTRYAGLAAAVEEIDVATPASYERYTRNWMASFEGWVPTPKTLMAKVPNTLPGLADFWMAGQWVQPGGGLPGGMNSARRAVQGICAADGKVFVP
jgi:phytoene dehydrogenase-like protein